MRCFCFYPVYFLRFSPQFTNYGRVHWKCSLRPPNATPWLNSELKPDNKQCIFFLPKHSPIYSIFILCQSKRKLQIIDLRVIYFFSFFFNPLTKDNRNTLNNYLRRRLFDKWSINNMFLLIWCDPHVANVFYFRLTSQFESSSFASLFLTGFSLFAKYPANYNNVYDAEKKKCMRT